MVPINTKKVIIILFSAFVLLFFTGCKNNADINVKIYAYVNGEAIITEEIEYFSEMEKTKVMQEFAEKYNITDFSSFWENEYNGESPKIILEKRAFERAVRAKILLVLMRDNGIYDSISFTALRDRALKFNNKNNVSAMAGISSINTEQFYSYYIQNGELELKNILGEGILKPSAEEIAASGLVDQDLSEEMIKQSIVEEKYQKYIDFLVEEANIEKQ